MKSNSFKKPIGIRHIELEALKEVLSYGFEKIGLETIHAEVDPDNLPSIKLLEKFHFICTKKEENTIIFSLEKNKFNS